MKFYSNSEYIVFILLNKFLIKNLIKIIDYNYFNINLLINL